MPNQTKALTQINDVLFKLKKANFNCSTVEKKQYNYETTAVKNNQKIKVQVYFGRKGVKTVLQGNNLSAEYQEIQSIVNGNILMDFKVDNQLQKNYDEYIGTDETGKGDYFGPLVVAAMFVNKDIQEELLELDVRDSKELTDYKIDGIAKKIKKKFPKNFSVIVIEPEKYNKLYEKFKNVNHLLNWAHSKVVENVFKLNPTSTIITDQFSKKDLELASEKEFEEVNFIKLPRGEQYIGVAAASILARHEMNNWFNHQQQQGFNVLKGASNQVTDAALNIYERFGSDEFKNLVKLHFKTTLKILQ
ncbi:MAG: ribonuclease HIII [Ignavibacteriae bacterium]|nr:ribonuclease HIII [Ignavibacteriota bacterium]MCB0747915.1 ribonuclease HIII [Ignavibacteriota bacterium]